MRRRKLNSARRYFTGVPNISPGVITMVRREAVLLCAESGCSKGRALSPLNDAMRACLSKAIFSVENRLESRGEGRPYAPTVVALRFVRNRVETDLGFNEFTGEEDREPDFPRLEKKRPGRELTPEQRQAAAERLRQARATRRVKMAQRGEE